METITHLKWRYATKKYNQEKVSTDNVRRILEAVNLSASSCGIQPYRVFVIEDQDLRDRLGEGSFNSQIRESSHLLVFAAFNTITAGYIEDYISMAEQQRHLPSGAMADLKNMLIAYFGPNMEEANALWSEKQAYIGLGTALIAAAELQVDSTPMEGFDRKQVDRILGLPEKGLHAAVILSLGYRDAAHDYLAGMEKVRLPLDEFAVVAP